MKNNREDKKSITQRAYTLLSKSDNQSAASFFKHQETWNAQRPRKVANARKGWWCVVHCFFGERKATAHHQHMGGRGADSQSDPQRTRSTYESAGQTSTLIGAVPMSCMMPLGELISPPGRYFSNTAFTRARGRCSKACAFNLSWPRAPQTEMTALVFFVSCSSGGHSLEPNKARTHGS
jgi:hypothetical protein